MSKNNPVPTVISFNWDVTVIAVGISTALTLCSCRGNTGGEQVTPGTLHPTEENIPAVEDQRFVLRVGSNNQSFAELTEPPAHTIGVREGRQHAMIGSISDMEFRRHALYYSDREYGEIRVYDHSGALLAVVGSLGNGPGEFSSLNRLAVTEDESRLFAWDMLSRIQVFVKQDSAYVLENTFHIVPNAYEGDICVVNGHLYAIGYSEELAGVIHKYTFVGDHVISFGARYKSSFSLLSGIMSKYGRLECDEQLGIIAHVNHYIPVLTGYSEKGNLVWRVKFGDFKPAIVEEGLEDGTPAITHWNLRKGESRHIALIRDQISESLIARYLVVGDDAEPSVLHYFSVHMQTGEGFYLGGRTFVPKDAKPNLVGLDADRVYALTYSPFPQVQIYNRSAMQL